ncbi:MAG: hypothetical protein AAF205_00085 [Pseudomonadota bacterium]
MTKARDQRSQVGLRTNSAKKLIEVSVNDGEFEFALTPEQALDVAKHLQIQAGFVKPSLMKGHL